MHGRAILFLLFLSIWGRQQKLSVLQVGRLDQASILFDLALSSKCLFVLHGATYIGKNVCASPFSDLSLV